MNAPCPFCGHHVTRIALETEYVAVECCMCGARGPRVPRPECKTPEEAEDKADNKWHERKGQ